MSKDKLISAHGGYRRLKSFQVAQLVYDVTVRFCERYVDRFSRTKDQMIQAARSGVQNIAEGSQASATSKKTEIKLTQVARASLEELKLDYEDFLRQRGFKQWERDNPLRQALIDQRCQSADEVARWIVRQVKARGGGGQSGQSGRSGRGEGSTLSTKSTASTRSKGSTAPTESTGPTASTRPNGSTPSTLQDTLFPEYSANAAVVLIAVACSLLDRQVASQAKQFEEEGGFTERLYRMRSAHRRNPPPE